MNRLNIQTLFLGLVLVISVAVLILVGLSALLRRPQDQVLPTPVVVVPQTLPTATLIPIPSPTPIQLPTATLIPPLVSPAGTLLEDRLALDFDLSAIRPEAVKAKLFEPVIGRPPSTTFVYCPSPYNGQASEPALCYDVPAKTFFLAGFRPNEIVYVISYVNGAFGGIAELRLDETGRGRLTGAVPLTDVFILRQNGAYISSDPALGSPYIV